VRIAGKRASGSITNEKRQLTTLTRYFNQTNEQLKKAAAALDAFNSMGIEP
jgi:hypothetical protein